MKIAATIFLTIFAANTYGQTLSDYAAFVEQWEGRRAKPYLCSEGYLTVGVGHRTDSRRTLSDAEITRTLSIDTLKALNAAEEMVEDFDSHPRIVKLILVDLAFNLGHTGAKRFVRAIRACNDGDYLLMSAELKDSRWYNQTKRRAKHHVEKLEALSN
jgi:lysozyme